MVRTLLKMKWIPNGSENEPKRARNGPKLDHK